MKSTKFWVAIIVFALIISIIATVYLFSYHGKGNIACVYQGGNLIERIHLNTVTTPYTFTVKAENGHYNTIQVEQRRICVEEASCPDHVCINTGWISDGKIPIVCLPNELVIQIESNSTSDVDATVQ